MPPKPPFQLTAEQLAKQEARRIKKLQQAAAAAANPESAQISGDHRAKVLERPWVTLQEPAPTEMRVSIKTWNLLAQALVRRKLFPASDCLKASQREPMMFRELLHPRADVLCLQEVDRLDKIVPFLNNAGYSHVYTAGPGKKHGCLIAFDKSMFEKAGETTVLYDSADRGTSFRTKNIGSIVALQSKTSPTLGLVVGTTHLFWHPSYNYERTRQAGLLLRTTVKFRDRLSRPNWPCILAGDFNFDPADPAYALLVGEPLLPSHVDALARSRVIHATIDSTVPITTRKQIGSTEDHESSVKGSTMAEGDEPETNGEDDDEGEQAADPDRRITNARPATSADGLFTDEELSQLYRVNNAPLKSAMDEGQRSRAVTASVEGIHPFGARTELLRERKGYYEPMWTSYTHYWKTTLDYVFILDPIGMVSKVCGYVQPPGTADLDPGIPMLGVGSSDHTSVHVNLAWSIDL